MNCRKAYRAMQDLLDGSLPDGSVLEEHLKGCSECRGELARLRQVQEAADRARTCEPDPERLRRVSGRVLAALAAQRLAPRVSVHRLRWAAVASAAVLLGFCGGLWTGRSVWPRQVTLTRVVTRPQVSGGQ